MSNHNAQYDPVRLRREFLKDIRAYGDPIDILDVRGQRYPCGFHPPCTHEAVELRIWHTHSEYLCQIEVNELKKKDETKSTELRK